MKGRQADHWRAVVLVGVLSAAPYLCTLNAGFVWDDDTHALGNPAIFSLRPLHFFTVRYWNEEFQYPGLYRPLHALTLAADHALWHKRAQGYHFTNLCLHVGASLAVAFFVGQWTRGLRVAVAAGIVFGLLPCHVEAVAWVKNRTILLMACFSVLAAGCFWRALRGPRRWAAWSLAYLAFAAALCSKPTALILPALLVALGLAGLQGRDRLRALAYTTPFWLGAVAFLAFRKLMFTRGTFAGVPHADPLSLAQHASVVADSFLFYVRMLLLPANMAPDRAFDLVRAACPAAAARIAAAIACGGLLLWAGHKSRGLAWALWLGISLAPIVNVAIIAGRPLAEQRLYLASVGLCAWGAIVLMRTRGPRCVLAYCAAVPLAALCAHQSVQWQNDRTLWQNAVRVAPNASRAQEWHGLSASDRGQTRLAKKHLLRALKLEPKAAAAWNRLGKIWRDEGNFVDAERAFKSAVAAQPQEAALHNDLGAFYATRRRWEEAVRSFDEAIKRRADYPVAASNRAKCIVHIARRLEAKGKVDAALAYLRKTNPLPHVDAATQSAVHSLWAELLLRKGRVADAMKHIHAALLLKPGDAALLRLRIHASQLMDSRGHRQTPR